MKWNYSVIDQKLLIEDITTGKLNWIGQPKELPVILAFSLPSSDDCVVLLKYSAGSQNLVRCRPDGSIAWQAELPGSEDAYTRVEWANQGLIANSWYGYRVQLDAETGRILSTEFVK